MKEKRPKGDFPMPEDISASLPFREEYDTGLKKLVENRRAELDRVRAERMSPANIAADREKFRREYTDLLGWPLNVYENYRSVPMNVRRLPHGENDFAVIWQMQFEVLPELWFYGLFFEHKNKAEDLPFVICQHGGLGTPEVVSGVLGETYNYNNLLERAANYGKGANTFAPGLYLWHDDYGPKKDRNRIDNDLKQLGGSIAALEVFAIRRTLDYFIGEGIAKEGHIGMIGLSYGGLYTLLTAAADPRINAAYSSCQYNDRYLHNWPDWTWKNSAMFLDAETAALVAPRALYLEEGDNDELFDDETFLKECERAVPFFKAADAEENLKYRAFKGTHELDKSDDGYTFVFAHL